MKVAERCFRVRVIAFTADEAIDAVGVGPIRFDGDGVESSLLDESAGDVRALRVELVGAVRRLSEKDDLRSIESLQQWTDVGRFASQRECGMGDGFRRRGWSRDGGRRVDICPFRRRGHPALAAGEQAAHLIVRCLPEIVIPETDGVKRVRSLGADHLVDDVAHRLADRARSDRHRADDPGWVPFAQGERARPQRRPGSQTVVDENDRLAGDIGWRLGSPVEALAAGKLAPLVGLDRVDGLSRNVELADGSSFRTRNPPEATAPMASSS